MSFFQNKRTRLMWFVISLILIAPMLFIGGKTFTESEMPYVAGPNVVDYNNSAKNTDMRDILGDEAVQTTPEYPMLITEGTEFAEIVIPSSSLNMPVYKATGEEGGGFTHVAGTALPVSSGQPGLAILKTSDNTLIKSMKPGETVMVNLQNTTRTYKVQNIAVYPSKSINTLRSKVQGKDLLDLVAPYPDEKGKSRVVIESVLEKEEYSGLTKTEKITHAPIYFLVMFGLGIFMMLMLLLFRAKNPKPKKVDSSGWNDAETSGGASEAPKKRSKKRKKGTASPEPDMKQQDDFGGPLEPEPSLSGTSSWDDKDITFRNKGFKQRPK